MSEGAEPLLAVRGLEVRLGGLPPLVTGISFDLGPGEVLGLAGESGAGKSTVALALLGHLPAGGRAAGAVRLEGRDILALPEALRRRLRGRRIAYVPQNPATALDPALRVGAQMRALRAAHGLATGRDPAPLAAALAAMGLGEPQTILGRYPHQLSGGQQQRVVLAMATLCDPAVLVLDEPTTGLDVLTQAQVIATLRALRDRRRLAMVYVTHDLALLAQIATRVMVLYAGRAMEAGPAAEVFARPRHPYARALIAARPRLDAAAPPRGIPGVLDRAALPPGCPFAPRCAQGVSDCARRLPPEEEIAPGHRLACDRWRLAPPAPAAPRRAADQAPPQPGAGPILSARDLSVRYPRGLLAFGPPPPPALAPVSFALSRGEVLGIVGASGSGKSTLARAVAGILPFSGELRLGGAPLPPLARRRPRAALRRIQIVFQNPDAALNPRRRIGESLADAARAFAALPPRAALARAAEALDAVGLPQAHLGRFPAQLSGGERQRAAIARALVPGPEVLLCDEVLSALDVSVQAGVLETLGDLAGRLGLALLFISHDLAVVRAIAPRILVLRAGREVAQGPAGELLAAPADPYLAALRAAVPELPGAPVPGDAA